jgi:alginate O-acetyltransferase complex protein AlgI
MLFNSLTFFYFFIVVLIGNYALPVRMRNGWILGCSFLFYASWSPGYIVLLMATAVVDYYVARKMGDLPSPQERRPWLIASLIFNLGSLAFFKYTNMFLATGGSLATWMGSSWHPPMIEIGLPLGISFYTFETISYGVDVYRGELKPKRSFFQYLSFLMFFPKLIAGPIVRASELLPQIPQARRCNAEGFTAGINLLASGFTKKVLLADNFAPFVESVFRNPSAHNRWFCLAACYGYSMQVYFDFSAYSDIARGCAKLVGYDLPLNFNQPYKAVSISDFWRRWHMTLSRWLRDYLYIPIGGNQGSRFLTYRNLFLTMLLGGLWHGANWTFVIWGALNGSFLLIERGWHDIRRTKVKRPDQMSWREQLVRGLVVFHLIAFTRIFFRSPTLSVAIEMLKAIARPQTTATEPSLALFAIPATTIAYIFISRWKPRVMKIEPRGFALVGYAALLLALLVLGASQAEFIYFQF